MRALVSRLIVSVLAVCCFGVAPAHAFFHLMQIEKIVGGVEGDVTAQAVQLRLRAALMGDVQNARLVAYDANGQNPIVICDMNAPVPNQQPNKRILICTPSFVTKTNPNAVPDFVMTANIPASYLAAGSLAYQSDSGFVQWRVCWGGDNYTGPFNMNRANAPDGSCAPAFPSGLPFETAQALCFPGLCTDPAISSAEDYIICGPAIVTDHEGVDYAVVETPRACCVPSGGCEELTFTECVALKGEPGPPGSNCKTVKCSAAPGSCCFENGDCLTLPRADCLVLRGIPGPEGSDCCDNPCRRSCCFPNGSCQDLPISECIKSGGQPGEFGSTCFDAKCQIFTIACCLPNGSCTEVTSFGQCEQLGGTSQGFGTNCSTVTCTPALLGCCMPDGSCENLTEADCLTMGGLPGSIPCTSAVCDIACCTPTGCLRVIFAGDCFDRYGGFQGEIGVPCETAGCVTLGSFACCLPDGTCTNTNLATCINLGGVFSPFTTCESVSCPQPLACCFSDGSCQLLPAIECSRQGGSSQLGIFECFTGQRGFPVCPQTEACCLPDGSCEELLPGVCASLGGDSKGPGVVCDSNARGIPAECSSPRPCCFADGSCQNLTPSGCEFFGGIQGLAFTTCEDAPCDQPVACCFSDGSCVSLPPAFCERAGGSPGVRGSSCDPNPCFQPSGACCRPDGSCFQATLAECDAVNGDWHGEFSFCALDRSGTPVACPQPRVACCLPNGQCSDVTADECVNILGGIPGPFGSECCSTACSLENHPCCFPDNVCMPMTPSDCVQAGGKPALRFPVEPCGQYECPPENDDCADALPITDGVTFFDNYNATDDGPREPEACGDNAPSKPRGGGCPGGFRVLGSDIWFCYTATCDGLVRVALCGSEFDTAVAVYEGCVCPKGASAIACNDDSAECLGFDPKDPKKPVVRGGEKALQSFLTFKATKGQQYLIRVGGYDCEQGSGRIEIECFAGPDNDDCANAVPLSENGTYFFCNINATNDGPREPMACGDDKPVTKPGRGNVGGTLCSDGIFRVLGSDIWYCYTASCTGNVSLAFCGSEFDTAVAIYNGCVCPTEASAIACNDDDPFCFDQTPRGALQSFIRFPVTQGQQYLIRIGGYDCEQGCGQFELTCTPGPANDECEFPISIGDGNTPFDTTNATTDGPLEDACAKGKTSEISNDVWFLYTASCTGNATASLCNLQTSFDTKIAAYDGSTCPTEPNSSIICNDQACKSDQSEITFPVVAGQQYLIRIGGFFGATGPGVLTMSCAPGDGTEACCLPNGSCQQVSPIACTKLGGISQGPGSACVVRGNAVVCPQPINCCLQTGTCLPLLAADCTAQGGDAIADCFVCGCLAADVDQSGQVGLGDTAFVITRWDTQGVPAYFPGDINGDGSIGLADLAVIILNWDKTCPATPLPRACCFPNNSCQELTLSDCIAQGGLPLQPESTCASANCAAIPRTGACCFPNGTCQDLSTDDCSIAGGQTRGIGTSCATTVCPAP